MRAGFGIFYERIQGNDMYQAGANNLFGGNPTISNVSLSDPHIGVDQTNSVISTATLPVTVNSITMLNSNNYKIPTSYQYSVGVEQQLAGKTVLSVAYVGNQGRHESEATEIDMRRKASCRLSSTLRVGTQARRISTGRTSGTPALRWTRTTPTRVTTRYRCRCGRRSVISLCRRPTPTHMLKIPPLTRKTAATWIM